MTLEDVKSALALPRPPGKRSVTIEGREVSIQWLNRRLAELEIAPQTPMVAPPSPPTAPSREEAVDHAKPHPVPHSKPNPNSWKPDGEHIKTYVITWVDRRGDFHVKKYAAKGIVTAITVHYMEMNETAIVSVVCVI